HARAHAVAVLLHIRERSTTEPHPLSLHDALPISASVAAGVGLAPEERKSQALLLGDPAFRNISLASLARFTRRGRPGPPGGGPRSEEHTSELQSREKLVCRRRLETKKKNAERRRV